MSLLQILKIRDSQLHKLYGPDLMITISKLVQTAWIRKKIIKNYGKPTLLMEIQETSLANAQVISCMLPFHIKIKATKK